MKLVQLKIKNFRCYRHETSIDLDNLTAFIGKNDAGKSTILEALEIFFNDKIVSLDKDDLNKHALAADDCVVEISCVFDDISHEIILDANTPTTLASEYLLNAQGMLEIRKSFKCDSTKLSKPQVFIVGNHPTGNQLNDLHQLKISQLKTRATELGVTPGTYHGTISSSIRKAIWTNAGNMDLALIPISIDKEDTKKIWERLEGWMPMFALFQSDRKSKDDDQEVTDPMRVAVKEALQTVEEDLQEIQQVVKTRAIEVANRTLAKLQEMNPELANQLIPDFRSEPKWGSIFSLTLSSDMNIPINKRGSGVRRLILLNFFRAEAERRKQHVNNPYIIYAFEEPETSQHPDHQRMLIKAFKELAASADTQVLLTTHTPALAGLIPNENLRLISKGAAGHVIVEKGTEDVYKRIAATLGVLPDPLSSKVQLLIGVEGPNDICFIKHINRLIRQVDNTLLELDVEDRVILYPLGGSLLKKWVTVDYLKNLNKVEFHIYDRDDQVNPPYQEAINALIARGGLNGGLLTSKRSMENYIHPDAIQRVMNVNVPMPAAFDDVPLIVAEAVYNAAGNATPWNALADEVKKQKISNAKKRLNDAVVSDMSVAEYQEMDPEGEIIGWFQEFAGRLT